MSAPLTIDAPQGSDAWKEARLGRATASEFAAVMAKGQGKTRGAYLRRILSERLTGKPIESKAYGAWQANLDRGHEQEPFGKMSFEALTGEFVEEVGFVAHPEIMAGCSPDGFLGEDGGVELKSVIPTVQIETILAGGYPSEHRPQIQGSMWLCNRRWWKFASFCPDMPAHLRLYVFRVERDETYIRQLEAEIRVFLAEIDQLQAKLMGLK